MSAFSILYDLKLYNLTKKICKSCNKYVIFIRNIKAVYEKKMY